MSAVALREVAVAYDGITAVGPIDHEVAAGTWLTLIGPNGAGKTSLLHAIAGVVDYAGTVTVDGASLVRMGSMQRARRVALVPQRPTIPDEMLVMDYVLLGRTPHIPRFGVESDEDREIGAAVLDRLELTAFAGRSLGHLSGGELQLVVLARALAQQAPVLLLDEPTTALDLGHQQHVLATVDELRSELHLTVISTMHDLTLAGARADRLVLLDHGRPVVSGTPAQVLTEETLRHYYHAEIQVLTATDGTIAVIPLARSRSTGLRAGR